MKLKAFFITFKGLSFAKNCLKPESAPLKNLPSIILLQQTPYVKNQNIDEGGRLVSDILEVCPKPKIR